jgi:hypothetical protein
MSTSLLEASTGRRRWAIAEGFLAGDETKSTTPSPVTDEHTDEKRSKHETLFLLNAGDEPAQVTLSIYFSDREPIGPFTYVVDARRTTQVELGEIEEIPRDLDFASLVESDKPIVVLATRRRTAEPDAAPLTQIAFAG